MTEPYDTNAGADPDIKENVKSRSTWLRLAFMILFAVIFYIVEFVLFAVAALQFLWKLFTGEANERLTRFGESLARFAYQIVRFLTFNTEEMPFPFTDWPGAAPVPAPDSVAD